MKFKNLNETYWIDNKEVMDQVSKLGKELEADGFKFYSDRYSGSTYYDFYTKRGDNGAICKAVQYSYEGAQIIDITIDQLIGKEPIDSFETMRRKLGRMLLPQNEAVEDDKEDKFVLYFPYLEPKIINKDRAIKQMEFELDEFKNNSGASIAGRGFGIYCLQSYDSDTDSVWTGRYGSKDFLKTLSESTLNEDAAEDIDDIVWPIGANTLTFSAANRRLKGLRNDIKLLMNCETAEDVKSHAHEFEMFNCANIIERKMAKGMPEEEAIDSMQTYLMQCWGQWKADMTKFKADADKATEAFNVVKNTLSEYELISADEDKCILKYRPIEGASHNDCIKFVDDVVAAVNGKYNFTGRGGSWTRWDIRTADGVMIKAGWDDDGDTWSVTFPRLKFESLEMAVGGDDFDGEIAAMRAEQQEREARRAARKERFALMHKLFDKHIDKDPNARWIDKIYDLFEDAEKVVFIGNKYGTLPGRTEDGQPIRYRYSVEEYDIYTDPYRDFVYIGTNNDDPLKEDLEDDFDLLMKASELKCKLSRYDIEEANEPSELVMYMEDVYHALVDAYGADKIKWWRFYEDDDMDGVKVIFKDGTKKIVEIVHGRVYESDNISESYRSAPSISTNEYHTVNLKLNLKESVTTQYVICGVTNEGTRMLYDAVNDNFTTDYAAATKYDDMDVARDDWFKIPRSGFRRIFIPIYDPAVFESVKEAFDADKVQKRIACTTEFDNGHVFHNDYFRASSAEAEERAKQASIENPDKVFYVKYDDVMNPSSDIKWKNGEQLTEDVFDDEGNYDGPESEYNDNGIDIRTGEPWGKNVDPDEPIYFDPDDEFEVDFRYYVYANNDDVVSDAFDFEEDAIQWAKENNYPIVKIHNYYRDTDGQLNPDGDPEVIWEA